MPLKTTDLLITIGILLDPTPEDLRFVQYYASDLALVLSNRCGLSIGGTRRIRCDMLSDTEHVDRFLASLNATS